MELLKTEDLGISFGGLQAVQDVNFTVNDNEIVGLIGPNGAGKTTVFNLLTGVYTPTSGTIMFEGKSLLRKKTYKINRMGIARTFQNIRLFKDLSVEDNVKVSMNSNMKYSFISGMLRLPKYWKEERKVHEKAMELLRVFDLDSVSDSFAKNLPYGQQRKLEIVRALASEPKLLLLDEPAAGMNPTETMELLKTVKLVKEKFQISVLLIEHDMNFVMGICDKIIVLDYGKIIAKGLPEQIKNDPKVIEAYLGG